MRELFDYDKNDFDPLVKCHQCGELTDRLDDRKVDGKLIRMCEKCIIKFDNEEENGL